MTIINTLLLMLSQVDEESVMSNLDTLDAYRQRQIEIIARSVITASSIKIRNTSCNLGETYGKFQATQPTTGEKFTSLLAGFPDG
jgi:hypothetical protein